MGHASNTESWCRGCSLRGELAQIRLSQERLVWLKKKLSSFESLPSSSVSLSGARIPCALGAWLRTGDGSVRSRMDGFLSERTSCCRRAVRDHECAHPIKRGPKTLRPISCSANDSALLAGGSHVNGGPFPSPEPTWEHARHRTGPPMRCGRQPGLQGQGGHGRPVAQERRGLPAMKQPSGSTIFFLFLPFRSASEATLCSGPIVALGPRPPRPYTLSPPQRGAAQSCYLSHE